MKTLSIVIPTYNVEKYIEECLSSLILLSKYDDVEVLVVNDGSKDNSAKIAKEYEKKYPNLFRVFDKDNGGYGSVLNYGIQKSNAKYIRVLDSDDWFENSNFDEYIEFLRQSESDIVATKFTMHNMTTKELKKIDFPTSIEEKVVYDFENVCDEVFVAMHMLTIKRSIYVDHSIFIDEKTFYTDLEFVIFPIKYINSIAFLNINLYQYRIGIPGQSVSNEGWYKNRFDHEKVTYRLINELSTLTRESPKYNYVKNKVFELITVHFRMYSQFNPSVKCLKKEILNFDKEITKIKSEWLKNCNNIIVKIIVISKFRLLTLFQRIYLLKKSIF